MDAYRADSPVAELTNTGDRERMTYDQNHSNTDILFAFIADTAAAQTVIKTTGDWSVLKYGSGKSRSCYIASAPQEETGNYKRRGDTFVMVSHRPGEGTRDVFELRAGYSYKKGSAVTVVIDGQKLDLFTQGSTAWAKDEKLIAPLPAL